MEGYPVYIIMFIRMRHDTTSLLSSLLPSLHLTVYHMMETGWVKVSQTDVGELHYKYREEKLAPRS